MTTGQNLTALDTQIKTNADNIGTNTTNISNNTENITNLKNLSNITEAGQTVIKNLAKGSIGMEDGSHTSVSHRDVNGVETYKVDVTVDGQVAENNTGIVNGGTVYSALQDVKNQTSADLANKANVDASNIGKNLNHKADGTAVTDEDKTVNENAWGAAIGTGSIAADNGQLVTGKTVYAYNKPVAAEGKTLNYISDTMTTGQNLTALDTQIKTNADNIGTNTTNISNNTENITNLKNLSNITEAGQTVIKNLAKGSIGMEDGSHTSVSHRDVNGVETYKVDVTVDGQVAENNTGIVNGGTVYSALQDVKNQTSADLANTADETRQITGVAAGKEETDAVNVAQLKKLNGMKANVNADNIGKNLNHKADGTAVTDEDKTVNENAWGAAIGTGSIAADNGQLVTGKTVYAYNKPVAAEGKTLNYVSDTKTTGQNLGSLDAQVGTNTGDISNLKNLSNISSAGETVIKNLAKGSIGMEDGSHTSVSHRDVNGVDTYKVDVTVDGVR